MSSDTEMWNINETLLQSYRSIFISSQSFLLAVGSIMWQSESVVGAVVLFIVAIIAIYSILCVWRPVVRYRWLYVDYYKHAANLDPTKRNEICTVNQYVHNAIEREKTNAIFEMGRHNLGPTRWKIDVCIPFQFVMIWAALVVSWVTKKYWPIG